MSDEGQQRRWVGRQAWWAPGFFRFSDRLGYVFAVLFGLLAVAFLFSGFWQLSALLVLLMTLNLLPLSHRFRRLRDR